MLAELRYTNSTIIINSYLFSFVYFTLHKWADKMNQMPVVEVVSGGQCVCARRSQNKHYIESTFFGLAGYLFFYERVVHHAILSLFFLLFVFQLRGTVK